MTRYDIVEQLAELGATVHTCARNEAELNECLHQWVTKGYKITGSVCDVSSRAQREDLIARVSSEFNGKLNILVSNYMKLKLLFFAPFYRIYIVCYIRCTFIYLFIYV